MTELKRKEGQESRGLLVAFNRVVDRFTKKKWSAAEIAAMLGPIRGAYLTHARDAAMRQFAASGGTTSALLIAALDHGQIDGAIVCRTFIEDHKVRAHFVVARTREEILAAQGSKYVETKFLSEVLPILERNDGRFAVCGLPCDITNLKRWEDKTPALAGKVALRVALMCGSNSRKELVDGVIKKLSHQARGQTLMDFRFRTGHWRGQLECVLEGGSTIRKPFSYFSDYRNLSFFAERKCLACIDHFGYASDISTGDVWLYSLRNDPIKHTGVLVRSERAARMLVSAVASGHIVIREVPCEMILDGQTRIAPVHYNIAARAIAGKWLGLKILDNHNLQVGPIAFLSAFIGLFNMRWSEGTWANAIFKIPRPLLRGYLFFKKGLESIK